MCPPVRVSAPACLCDISATRGLPSHWGVGGYGLSSLDSFTLFAGWVVCCLVLNLVRRVCFVIRLKKTGKKMGAYNLETRHMTLTLLPCQQARQGALVTLPLAAPPQQAVRCSPPQFPSPRKVAVANFSRHLCFDEMTFITLLTYFEE